MEREKLKGGIFITTKDIQVLNGGSLRQAQREYLTIKDILQVKKLTVSDYCEYYNIDQETVIKYLNNYR